jgi:hypothetical protein
MTYYWQDGDGVGWELQVVGDVWARTAGNGEVVGIGGLIGGWWFGKGRKMEKGWGGRSKWLVVVHVELGRS